MVSLTLNAVIWGGKCHVKCDQLRITILGWLFHLSREINISFREEINIKIAVPTGNQTRTLCVIADSANHYAIHSYNNCELHSNHLLSKV